MSMPIFIIVAFLLGAVVTMGGVWLGGSIKSGAVLELKTQKAMADDAARGEVVTLPDPMGDSSRGEVIQLNEDRVRGSIFDDIMKQNNRLTSQLAAGMVPATDGSD
jgi:hypothetical protein